MKAVHEFFKGALLGFLVGLIGMVVLSGVVLVLKGAALMWVMIPHGRRLIK